MNRIEQGNKIREARHRSGLTALQVARRVGMDEMRVYAIERGRVRIDLTDAAALGAAMNVDPKTLAPELFRPGVQDRVQL